MKPKPDPQELTRLLPTAVERDIPETVAAIRRLDPAMFRALTMFRSSTGEASGAALRQAAGPHDPEWNPPTGPQHTRRGTPLGDGARLHTLSSSGGTRLRPNWRPRQDVTLPPLNECNRREAEQRLDALPPPLLFHITSWMVLQSAEALDLLADWVDQLENYDSQYAQSYRAMIAATRRVVQAHAERAMHAASWHDAVRALREHQPEILVVADTARNLSCVPNTVLWNIVRHHAEALESYSGLFLPESRPRSDRTNRTRASVVLVNAALVVGWMRSPHLDEVLAAANEQGAANDEWGFTQILFQRGQVQIYMDRTICAWGAQAERMFAFQHSADATIDVESLPEF